MFAEERWSQPEALKIQVNLETQKTFHYAIKASSGVDLEPKLEGYVGALI